MALPVMFSVCSSSEPSAVSPDRRGLLGGLIVSTRYERIQCIRRSSCVNTKGSRDLDSDHVGSRGIDINTCSLNFSARVLNGSNEARYTCIS